MSRTATHWTDERLDDLADAIEPVPVNAAVLDATVTHLTAALEPVPSELAVLAATVDRLAEENRALRAELSTTQQQLLTVGVGSRDGAHRCRSGDRLRDGLTQRLRFGGERDARRHRRL